MKINNKNGNSASFFTEFNKTIFNDFNSALFKSCDWMILKGFQPKTLIKYWEKCQSWQHWFLPKKKNDFRKIKNEVKFLSAFKCCCYVHVTRCCLECENFIIFLSLRFYVKSIFGILDRSAKYAILTHLQALFALFCRLKCTKSTKFRGPKMAKKGILGLLDSPKLISRKIWMIEKFVIFQNVLLWL